MVNNVISLMDYKQKRLDKLASAVHAFEDGADPADIFAEMSTEELEKFVNFFQDLEDDSTTTTVVTLTVVDDEND